MKTRTTLSLIPLTLWLSTSALAEVTLDGTLGRAGALPGPDYQIGADLGSQHGDNLFHSFRDFNLQSHESATFNGPNTVQNIISRVTGGNPSSIDGTLRSTIPNADLYFLNPYGILFGKNAKLDVQGGFHASTADYLKLQDGGRFEARYPNNSLLTVAPIAAFGFLTETPAAIKTQDSQLSVPSGKTFSLIGGDLELNASTPPVYGKSSTYSFMLFAESGRLHLASVASRGEVIPTPLGLDLQATAKQGSITLTNALLSVSGDEGNGNVFIRGGHFQMTKGWIENNNTATQAGGITDVQVEDLTFREGAGIDTSTLGTGQGGSINLKVTNALTLMTGGNIHVNSTDTTPQAGNSGTLTIQARQVNLSDGANIRAAAFGAGHGGTLHLQVSETLNVTNAAIDTNSYNTILKNAGDAGNLMIQARNVKLTNGAQLASVTYGTGQGGMLSLKVSETLTITGQATKSRSSGVFASSMNDQLEMAGAAGNLDIEARQIVLQDGARIVSNTYGTGQGGTLHLQASETLTVSGRGAINHSPSSVYAGSLNHDELYGSGRFLKEGLPAGQAGEIFIQANTLNLLNGGRISTQQTRNTGGGGGNLTLSTANRLYLQQGQITTSVKGGKGNSGNITIDRPQFVVLDKGEIRAQADEGRGGNIRIVADQFLKTPDSLISASSRVGLDGQVRIESPDQTIGDSLVASPKGFTDLTGLLPRFCENLSFEEFLNRSTFYIYPIAGDPLSPYDLKPSHAFRSVPRLPTVGPVKVSKEKPGEGKQRLGWLTGCHQ